MELDTPLISVIIPAYNAECTLRETLDSVLLQTYRNLEILVVNDGSTDKTEAIALSFKDERIRIIHTPRLGQTAATNTGILESKGTFIAFCKAQDIWLPLKTERQLATFKKFPEIALTHSWATTIDSASAPLRLSRSLSLKGNVFKYQYKANFFECLSTVMVRKEVLDQLGTFDEKLTGSEEWDLWCRIAQKYQIATTYYVDVLYRELFDADAKSIIRKESTSRNIIKKFLTPETKPFFKSAKTNITFLTLFKALESACSAHTTLYFTLKVLWINPKFLSHVRLLRNIFLRIILKSLLPYSLCQQIYFRFTPFFDIDEVLELIELPLTKWT